MKAMLESSGETFTVKALFDQREVKNIWSEKVFEKTKI